MSAATTPPPPAPPAPPPRGSFTRRRIAVTFVKGDGNFASTNSNTVTLSGLRVNCTISQAGGKSMGALDLRVFGMTETMMNELTYVGKYLAVEGASGTIVQVQAGTDETGLTLVYQGTVSTAIAEYGAAPEVPFHVMAMTGLGAAMSTPPPLSYSGSPDASVVMADIARGANLFFENNGVSNAPVNNCYYHGSALDQLQKCADEAGIEMAIVNDKVAIWPKGGSRGGLIPLVSPSTGMVGYPVKTPIGINFVSLFNPSIKPFSQVQVETSLPKCNGTWTIKLLDYSLESEAPGGEWFIAATCLSPLDAIPVGQEQTPPPPTPPLPTPPTPPAKTS
jgi:hypothetical protein